MNNNWKSKERCVLIFSGFNQRAIVAFIRTLEQNEVPYLIIAIPGDTITLTSYAQKCICTRKRKELVLDDILECLDVVNDRFGFNEYLIAPSSEALNRFLLMNRGLFEQKRCIIPLVSSTLYNIISDKYSFGQLCKEHGICIPSEVGEGIISYPIVAKPKKYFSTSGKSFCPEIIFDYEQYKSFFDVNDINDFYFQEYISGESIYLLYYFSKDGSILKYSQKNFIQQPNGKSIIAAIGTDDYDSVESDKYESMFKSIEFYGFVMVEMKRYMGKNYMIEANPRFWGPSQLFVDAGCNFFEKFLQEYLLIKDQAEYKIEKHAKYFWFGGMMETLVKSQSVVWHECDKESFLLNMQEWIASDIYKRSDTIAIFLSESNF